MAFNIETFKTRALTSVVFVALMLAGLFINHWTFFLLFSVIHFGCWFEYEKLVELIDANYKEITPFHKYGVMLAGWSFMLWNTSDAYMLAGFRLHEIGWFLLLILAVVLPVTEVLLSKHLNVKNIAHSFFGLLYISLSLGCMMDLRSEGMMFNLGWVIPVVLIASIWINDTMAYIVGSFIGKTPFSKISPKKTVEGTLGGIILSVMVVTLCGYFLFGLKDVASLIIISSIAGIIGTAGDLLESKLKRMAGVKDSGHIMPGHGGFLDRFDSLLLATPFVWLYVNLLM